MAIAANTQVEKDFLSDLVRYYQVALGRQPDAPGLEYWFNQGKANGFDLIKTTKGFLPQEVLLHSPARFLDDLYHSVLGRDADQGGFDFWLGQINAGKMTYQQVALSFALSGEFKAATNAGVADVVAKAISGAPIDPLKSLAGIPLYDYGPQEPVVVEIIKEVPVEVIKEVIKEVPVEVIKEVPVIYPVYQNVNVPTAEAHTLSLNADTTVSLLARKANGDFLPGTGNPNDNFAVLHDNTANVEIAARILHRQSAVDVNPINSGVNGNRAFVEYNIDAGTQDGEHGAPVNVNRSDAQMHFAISGAPGFMSDGDTQYVMKFYKADVLVNTIKLTADANGNQVWKMPDGVTIAIGDDPVSTTAITNSVNMAFGYSFADADLDPGTYKISIEQVGLVGLQANQVTAALDVIFHAV